MENRKMLERLKRIFKTRDDIFAYVAGIVLPILFWQVYSSEAPDTWKSWLILIMAMGMTGLFVLLFIYASLDIFFDIPAEKTEQVVYGLFNWFVATLLKILGLLILIWSAWYLWTSIANKEEIAENYSSETIEAAQEMYEAPVEDLTEDQLEEAQQQEVDVATSNCNGDCSGHQAGYEWAQENSISSDSDCDGNSNSFNEGCVNYVDGGSGY